MSLTPQDYVMLDGNDLVELTRGRVGDLERAHYGALLESYEVGMSGPLARRLSELEERRAVQLARLMPPDASEQDAPDGAAAGGEPPDGEPPADGAGSGEGEGESEQGEREREDVAT